MGIVTGSLLGLIGGIIFITHVPILRKKQKIKPATNKENKKEFRLVKQSAKATTHTKGIIPNEIPKQKSTASLEKEIKCIANSTINAKIQKRSLILPPVKQKRFFSSKNKTDRIDSSARSRKNGDGDMIKITNHENLLKQTRDWREYKHRTPKEEKKKKWQCERCRSYYDDHFIFCPKCDHELYREPIQKTAPLKKSTRNKDYSAIVGLIGALTIGILFALIPDISFDRVAFVISGLFLGFFATGFLWIVIESLWDRHKSNSDYKNKNRNK